jgi:hypothetical protein
MTSKVCASYPLHRDKLISALVRDTASITAVRPALERYKQPFKHCTGACCTFRCSRDFSARRRTCVLRVNHVWKKKCLGKKLWDLRAPSGAGAENSAQTGGLCGDPPHTSEISALFLRMKKKIRLYTGWHHSLHQQIAKYMLKSGP